MVCTLTVFITPLLEMAYLKEFFKWWARSDLNRRPKNYEFSALTAELQALLLKMVPKIGLEPIRLYSRNILSVVRLPISPHRHIKVISSYVIAYTT
jgi:hypothetical protein